MTLALLVSYPLAMTPTRPSSCQATLVQVRSLHACYLAVHQEGLINITHHIHSLSLLFCYYTARYMSPEVIRSEHYGLKADVFSFCMLLHEIMALVKPFDKFSGKEVKEQVAVLGRRPFIQKSWPMGIRKLLRRGFSDVPEIRPNMEDIQDALEDIVDCL